jgi:predicted permease
MSYSLLEWRLAARRLRARPGFAFAVVAILALCLGANTTIFSLLSGLLLQPLPVAHPERLAAVNIEMGGFAPVLSYPDYRDMRDQNNVLDHLIGYRIAPVRMEAGPNPERVWGYLATGNYFRALGATPHLGRLFTEADDRSPGAHPVVVLSHRYWQTRFASDPQILQRKLLINGLSYTVIGVARPGFFGSEVLYRPSFWAPMMMQGQIEPSGSWLERRGTQNMMVAASIKPGVTRAAAEQALNAIAARIAEEHPETSRGLKIVLSDAGLFGAVLRGPAASISAVLLGVVLLVLLIACVNIAGLMLARAGDRSREMAVSLALGAARSQLLKQYLRESALLAAAGVAAGTLLAWKLSAFILSLVPSADIPLGWEASLDWPVLAFSAALGALTVLACGIAPGLRATRISILEGLKNEAASRPGRKVHLRDALVALQIAITLVPLAAAFLALSGMRNAVSHEIGFRPESVGAVKFDLALQGFHRAQSEQFLARLQQKLDAHPRLAPASFASALPLTLDFSMNGIYAEGGPAHEDGKPPTAVYYEVAPRFFQTLGTPLVAGREFDTRDKQDAPPVAILNATAARRLFPGRKALGRRIKFGRTSPWIEVVGIAANGKYRALLEDDAMAVFVPIAQSYNSQVSVIARSPEGPEAAAAQLQAVIGELDPRLPTFSVGPFDRMMRLALFPHQLAAWALAAFAALALVLSLTGVFGLVAYAASRRTREIGLRIALGATGWRAVRGMLARTALLVAAGAAAGLALALAAAAAALLPARRAARLDPMKALRTE